MAGPKLTDPQQNMLKKVVAHKGSLGYHPAKVEHKVLETLLKHKLVKKGPKHPETKLFHYQVSTTGKKHLEICQPRAEPQLNRCAHRWVGSL